MAKDLHAAVLALQSEIGTLQKNALNPHFKSRYLSLDALVEHVQPLLTKHGLIWICKPMTDEGTPTLHYALMHAEEGGAITGEMPLLLEKQNAQGLGSAITYARRYALCAVLNIVADVDDDGEKASKQKGLQAVRASEITPVPDFASKVRATGMKALDIKNWLQTEGGCGGEVAKLSGPPLAHFLNRLSEEKQSALLAWAENK